MVAGIVAAIPNGGVEPRRHESLIHEARDTATFEIEDRERHDLRLRQPEPDASGVPERVRCVAIERERHGQFNERICLAHYVLGRSREDEVEIVDYHS